VKKKEAVLKAISLFLGINALVVCSIVVGRWFLRSSLAHWLEMDKPTKPYVPGTLILLELFLLIGLVLHYREKVKRD